MPFFKNKYNIFFIKYSYFLLTEGKNIGDGVVLVEAAVVVGGFICHEFFLPWL
jgi:hypothetical protein